MGTRSGPVSNREKTSITKTRQFPRAGCRTPQADAAGARCVSTDAPLSLTEVVACMHRPTGRSRAVCLVSHTWMQCLSRPRRGVYTRAAAQLSSACASFLSFSQDVSFEVSTSPMDTPLEGSQLPFLPQSILHKGGAVNLSEWSLS